MWAAASSAETYFAGRTLFRRDFQLTTRFFPRADALDSFLGTIGAERTWIWHMHASGGVGKTTFLRWLIARHLLPKPGRAICARIDFDDYRLDVLVTRPLRAIADILRQVDRQRPSTDLQDVVRSLDAAASEPGWNEGLIESVAMQLGRVKIDIPVVVVLDTLEDATRTQAAWLCHLVETIAKLRFVMPKLTLVLSGRHNVSDIMPALANQTVVFELRRFDHAEANTYLEQIEGIASLDIREAVLDRADETEQAPGDRRFNPFKLYLLAEIVRGDPDISAARISGIESVDLAYLIERVILRIKDQPLRWLIRYAVVARELDARFLDAVLLPELKASLEGTSGFDKVETYRGEEIWRPDPSAAANLSADLLLEELRRYATDRGWISVDTGGAIVRLHPEVIEPTRKLLAGQKVYRRLHDHALKMAGRMAAQAETPLAWASAKSMEIFHRYQLDPGGGIAAWREAVQDARGHGGSAVEAIAKEILGKDYEGCGPVCHAEAHLLAARALIERVVAEAVENIELRTQIVTHIEAAVAQHPDSVDPAFRELANRLSRPDGDLPIGPVPTDTARQPLGLAYLHLVLAWRLSVSSGRDQRRLAGEYVANVRRMRTGKTTLVIGNADLALWQSAIGRGLSESKLAKEALDSIGFDGKSKVQTEYSIVLAKTANALLDHDLGEAKAQLVASSALAKLGQPDAVQSGWSTLLRMDYAIAAHDPLAAFEAGTAGLNAGLLPSDRMGVLCRMAFAEAMACEFDRAEDHFREAEALIEETDNAASSGLLWERLKWRMRTVLRCMRYPNLAERLLDGGMGRGRLAIEQEAQVALFRVWIDLLRGNAKAAGERLPPPNILTNAEPGTAWALALATLGLAEPSRNAELVAILEGPLPATGEIYFALECVADRLTGIPSGLFDIDRFIARLPRIGRFGPAAEVERSRQAELLHLLGRRDLARKRIGKPFDGFLTEANLLMAIEYEACRQRHGFESDLDRLFRYAERKGRLKERARGLTAAAAVLSAEELVSDKKWEKARTRALVARHHFWEQREPSGWSQRIWEIAALSEQMTHVAEEAAHTVGARGQQVEVGLMPLAGLSPSGGRSEGASQTDWVRRKLSTTIAQGQFDIHAPVWDRSAINSWVAEWLRDPEATRDQLTEIAWFAPVALGARVQIEIERSLASSLASALPWELARVFEDASVIRRTIGPGANRPPPTTAREARGATLLIARSSEANFSIASIPSVANDIAKAYQQFASDDPFFQIDPTRTDIFARLPDISGAPIEIVHIVASMQEAKGGYALDFRATAEYARPDNAQFTARHLQSLLGSLRSRPLVILDIEMPENDAAAAEMLVQRNAFAQELYDPGLMAGLIATGLAPYDRSNADELQLIEALVRGATVGEAYTAIRTAPVTPRGLPGELYWSRASALWCEDADEAVRAPRSRA